MIEYAKHILQQQHMKVTPQRLYTLVYFLKEKNHPTVDELRQYLQTFIPNISKTTVYNVLEDLSRAKILEKIPTLDGIIRYDIQIEPHHHLIDISNHTIIDFKDEELFDVIQHHIAQKLDEKYEVVNIHVEIEVNPKKHDI
ncbi:MAG: transcriptional repressor [Bacteroidales bacterium]|nr:transcriptional repressor [Bacteroidales bacterium]